MYGSFYEPSGVQIGATNGEWVEVTNGLSVGEQLVRWGSLSLYAESRKTQTATTVPGPETATTPTDEVSPQNQTPMRTIQSAMYLTSHSVFPNEH
ncbi:hypothetical protein B9T07_12260 [Limnospira fusiformis CCALA 023]|nr:hypothetical protein AP285_07940 [Arthrospira platensis YZ]KDR54434.1 hypothetical protein APPUASWS_028325 [Arthrospira platensis str. Paraca]BAI89639.1 cation efflux system protein NrsB, fragment [Arthrospira platensis NIES-39]